MQPMWPINSNNILHPAIPSFYNQTHQQVWNTSIHPARHNPHAHSQFQVAIQWMKIFQNFGNMPLYENRSSNLSINPLCTKRNKHKLPKSPRKFLSNTLCNIENNNNKDMKDEILKKEKLFNTKSRYATKFTPAFEVSNDCNSQLSRIPNRIGPFECKLCGTLYVGAVQLAHHRCPQILTIEHRCPDCLKIFNCPANLASHRRWHKPKLREDTGIGIISQASSINSRVVSSSFDIDSIINVEIHKEECKDSQDRNMCQICSKIVCNVSDLENHVLDHLMSNYG